MRLIQALSAIVVLSLIGLSLHAQTQPAGPITFDFKDPKGVNAIGIFLNSELEPIRGYANGISGTIHYDPANPESFAGFIVVDAGSIRLSNSRMTEVLQGADWLNIAEHLTIKFDFTEVTEVEREDDDEVELEVKGTLTCAGMTLDQDVEIEATYLQGAAKQRGGAESGNLLVLRAEFEIDRGAFGIQRGAYDGMVADEIEIAVAIVGYSK